MAGLHVGLASRLLESWSTQETLLQPAIPGAWLFEQKGTDVNLDLSRKLETVNR